jgi:dihydrolipoamide dehydrogenase
MTQKNDMRAETTTLLVIGGGPGGYVAAIRAGQLGIPTVLVEGAASWAAPA